MHYRELARSNWLQFFQIKDLFGASGKLGTSFSSTNNIKSELRLEKSNERKKTEKKLTCFLFKNLQLLNFEEK